MAWSVISASRREIAQYRPDVKRRIELLDDYGNHITTVDAPANTAGFEGADFSGLCAPGLKTGLRSQNLRRAQLYWAMLQEADLSGCNLEGADLRGANLRDACLVGANMRGADLGRDKLGGSTSLQGANLADAVLNGAKLSGAVYDSRTIFPRGFSPQSAGMIEEGANQGEFNERLVRGRIGRLSCVLRSHRRRITSSALPRL